MFEFNVAHTSYKSLQGRNILSTSRTTYLTNPNITDIHYFEYVPVFLTTVASNWQMG
jgi:uncharacterized protein YfbU (UPF0304 family)